MFLHNTEYTRLLNVFSYDNEFIMSYLKIEDILQLLTKCKKIKINIKKAIKTYLEINENEFEYLLSNDKLEEMIKTKYKKLLL